MPSARALADPLALGLLGSSLVLALGVQILEPWSGRALWIVGWGVAFYAVAVAARLLLRPGPKLTVPTTNDASVMSGGTLRRQAPASESPDGADSQASNLAAMPIEDVSRLVGQALRDLPKTGRLAESELITLLPRSLHAARRPGISPSDENAHALAAALNAGIDGLKPLDGVSPTTKRQDVHYKILHEEYRLGMSPTQIMVRLEVTDATFFRWRNEAVSAVTRMLVAREERLRLGGTEDPIALDYLG